MEAFQKAMQSDEAAEAMRFDGVRPETLVILAGHLTTSEDARQVTQLQALLRSREPELH
jgi:hypothetical protein